MEVDIKHVLIGQMVEQIAALNQQIADLTKQLEASKASDKKEKK